MFKNNRNHAKGQLILEGNFGVSNLPIFWRISALDSKMKFKKIKELYFIKYP